MDPDLPVKIDVHEKKKHDGTYQYSFTYERASLYEYRYERAPHPDPVDPCHRCYRRVPPNDQVNVGTLYHRQCFRCRVCGLPLTVQTFHRNDANGSADREVYCKTHVGKLLRQIKAEAAPLSIVDTPNGDSRILPIDTPTPGHRHIPTVIIIQL